MGEVFGVRMGAIAVVLVALLVGCVLSVAWVAWRRPVAFRLGVRNIPRRRAQTVLIVVGLMLSTMIIAAALGVGDTVDHSTTAATYAGLGHVDELVVASQGPEGNVNGAFNQKIPDGTLGLVEAAVGDDARVDGVMPILLEVVPALNDAKRQGAPEAFLLGIDPARLPEFGGMRGVDGGAIDLAATAEDAVVLSETAAEELDAAPGGRVTVFYANRPLPFTVAAVAEDSPLTGRFDTATPGMVVPLARLQRATGSQGVLTMVAVSNAGGVREGLAQAEGVAEALRGAVAVEERDLGVDPIKRRLVDLSARTTDQFTGFFLVLGLFSVAAGIVLIVLIFTMLAAERRPELGMARAVGLPRAGLVQQFVAEGSAYALLAGLVGAGLGVGAAVGIGHGLRVLFGEFLPIEPRVTPRSMLVAYCLGVVITFGAVVASSVRISRLNVVAAVRDIPDVSSPAGRRTTLLWATLLVAAGAGLTLLGQRLGQAFPFYLGMSLLPFGVALGLRFAGAPGRPVLSLVGVYLLALWLLPFDRAARVFGELDGGFEMFFLSGIFMVVGATVLAVNNLGVLLAGVGRLGGLFGRALPAVRTAIAYPGATPGRTGMTIGMFSLIVFSLVLMATMSANFQKVFLGDEANAGWDVRADQLNVNPVADFAGAIAGAGVEPGAVAALGRVEVANFRAPVRLAGTEGWRTHPVQGVDPGFLAGGELLFQQRAAGYGSDAAVVAALASEPGVAVIDAFSYPDEGPFAAGPPNRFVLETIGPDEDDFAPIPVEVEDPATGAATTLRIIGVVDGRISSLYGLYANREAVAAIYPQPQASSFFLRLAEPARAGEVAKRIEAGLLTNGVQAVSIRDELAENQRFATGFLYLIEGFMGLGLVVGIAAVGVIAFRSVVERRQQIGVLRAIGFPRGIVSLSFLIETAFVVALGVAAGTILGIILARNLFASPDVGAGEVAFVVPWLPIAAILAATVAVALLMAWVPSRQAARVAPAEALRYE